MIVTRKRICQFRLSSRSETLTRKREHDERSELATKKLCRQCGEGSYATQSKREYMLSLMANQLHELGYRGMTTQSLKPKHIEALLKLWREQDLLIGTIKNRMAMIR